MVVFDTDDEKEILRHIVDGLSAAVYDTEVSFGANASSEFRNDRDIRTNKFVLEAIDEADLPVLWSWFRYGRSVANAVATGREVGYEPLSEDEEDEVANGAHPNAKPKAWYRDFFINDIQIGDAVGIQAICELSIDEFLEAAYNEAPEEHKSLYLANLEMQEMLRDVALSDDWHGQGPEGEFFNDLWDISRRFQKQVILHDEIGNEGSEAVSEFLRLLRQAVKSVSKKGPHALTGEQEAELYSLTEDYHDVVWRLAAMRISSLTVHGRNKPNKRKEFNNRADEALVILNNRNKEIRNSLERQDLLKSSGNWVPSNEQLYSRIQDSESVLFS